MNSNIKKLIKKIRRNLSDDLLKEEYKEDNENNPMYGHCYVATEVLYHKLLEIHPYKFKPFWGKDKDGITHWWIVDIETGTRYDITSDQYYSKDETPPYDKGKGGAFLTKEPSERSKKILEKIGGLSTKKEEKQNKIVHKFFNIE